jgi:radical SAM superfamily enzyme
MKNNPNDSPIDLDSLTFPYEGYEQIDKNRIYYYESSRGCPFNCSYCLSSTIKGVRQRSLDKVKKELMWFIERNVPLVKFIDRTFNSSKRFSMEIWSFLMEHARNTRFHFEIEADLLDDDALELLSKAPKNLFQFEIGVQTTNKEVLKNINRIMDFKALSSNILKIVEQDNIECHLDLIAGLPGENIQSFRKSFDDCMEISPHVLQLGFLKVLKGSPMMDFIKDYDLRFMPCAPYQILSTMDMDLEDMSLLIRLEQVLEDFYNSRIFFISMSIIMEGNKSQFDFFSSFSRFAEGKGYFSRRFDLKDKFSLLYEFCSSHIPYEQLKELLAMDYLLATKKTYLPEFLQIQAAGIYNERIAEIKNRMKDMDFRFTVFMPVSIRVIKKGKDIILEKWDGLCSIGVKNGNIEYYKI